MKASEFCLFCYFVYVFFVLSEYATTAAPWGWSAAVDPTTSTYIF